jgi:hypothetical protein
MKGIVIAKFAGLALVCALGSGCVAAAAVGAVGSVAGATIGAAGRVAGAGIDAVTPEGNKSDKAAE